MLPTDIYVLGIFNKEKYVYLEELQFQPSQSYELPIDASNFDSFNGGVFRLVLFWVLRPLIWYDRFTNTYQPPRNKTTPLGKSART